MLRLSAYSAAIGFSLVACFFVRAEDDWSSSVKFPAKEKPVKLFNCKDFEGWEGNVDKYFKVKEGIIVARIEASTLPRLAITCLPKSSTAISDSFLREKLAESSMHSGIALWGKKFEKDGETFSYQGHLVMFPSGWVSTTSFAATAFIRTTVVRRKR